MSSGVETSPRARPGSSTAPATSISVPAVAATSFAGTVTLVARGPAASASKSVNQIEPVSSAPGRLCTVWRIQIARPPPGRVALM